MITLGGSGRRSYLFPAPLPQAFEHHRDLGRMIGFLPHIALERQRNATHFRLLYEALEAGFYSVRIYCEVEAALDAERHRIRIDPAVPRDRPPIESGWNFMTGAGEYASEIVFAESGGQTRIDCSMRMGAELPVPVALQLLPRARLQAAADRIFRLRLDEILDRFIAQSIRAYSA